LKSAGHRWPLRLSFAGAAAIAFFVGAVLLGPTLVDLPALKSGVERKISQAANGQVTWEELQVRLLPVPRIELRAVAIDIPGRLHATIEQAQARLALFALLRGHVEVSSIAVTHPVVRLQIPSSPPAQNEPARDPLAVYRSVLAPLALAVQKVSHGALLEVSEAELQLNAGTLPELRVGALSLRAQTDATGLDLQVSAASNFWDRLRLSGRVELADLSANLNLEVTGINAQPWLDRFLANAALGVNVSRANVSARLVTDAKTELTCDFGLNLASVELVRTGQRLPVAESNLKGRAVLRAHESELTLSELRAGSLLALGQLQLHTTGMFERPEIALDIPALDVSAVRDAVLALTADRIEVGRYVARARGGILRDLKLRAEADTWEDLVDLDRLDASATLADAKLLLPALELTAENLNGRIALRGGNIELADARTQLGASVLRDAWLRYSIRSGAAFAGCGFDLDLGQALAVVRQVLSPEQRSTIEDIEEAAGHARGRAQFAYAGSAWNASVDITQSEGRLRVRPFPWPVTIQTGRVAFSPQQVRVHGLQALVGRSNVFDAGATLLLGPQPRFTDASGQATLVLDEVYPWLQARSKSQAQTLDKLDAISGNIQITLNSLSGALSQPSALAFDATALPGTLSVTVKGLPGPLQIAGGAVHVDASTVDLDRVSVTLLDSQALVSGRIFDYRGAGLQIRANISEALFAEKAVHWIWQQTEAPAQFEPRTPIRLALAQGSWSPNGALEAQAGMAFEGGPEVTLDIHWDPPLLDLRRLVLRDRNSQATLRLRENNHLVEASFSGSVFAQSVAALLRRSGDYQGQVSGDLRVTLDLERQGRTSAQGRIKAQGLDLQELLPERYGAQARVDQLVLSADGSSLQIQEAAIRWAQQEVAIHGVVARKERGVFVDLTLDSPGIEVDALLPQHQTSQLEAKSNTIESVKANRAQFFSWLSALGLSGQVKLRSNFIQFRRYRLQPVEATFTLGEQQVNLHLHDTQLCGLTFPMTMQIAPAGIAASVQISAHKQQLETVARCLTDQRLVLTGEFDARANLSVKGSWDQRLTELEGPLHLEAHDGVVRKFALIGNILAMKDVSSLLARGQTGSSDEGFAYRTLDLDGNFHQGRFLVEDFAFDSSAFGLAAEGSIGLTGRDTQLTALVAPFSRVTNLIRKIPVIGYLEGGTLTSVPVAVRGDIGDPTVVPLDPSAVASDLTALFTRALRIPEKLLAPFGVGSASPTPSTGH